MNKTTLKNKIRYTKRFEFISIILIVQCVCFLACSSKNSSRKPISFISFDTKKESIVIGDELSIQIRTKSFNNDFKNTIIYLDDSIIATSNIESFDFKLDTKNLLPGKKIIKSKAICSNNKVGFYNLEFLLLSDIVPSERSYEIIEILPHSPTFFTQGLEFHNNILYEGTGQYGSSGIYAYYPGKNKIIKSVRIEDQYFGEGITILNNRLYQLTYQSKIGFIYDLQTLSKIGQFSFNSHEGWGLTNDGKNLIMSDGTSKITFISPENFHAIKTIEVTDHLGTIDRINELEYLNGSIYANIWTTEYIIRIDAETGKVLEKINLKGLRSTVHNDSADVLNGIAWNPVDQLFYVTGKYWPNIYKLKFH